MDYDNVDAKLSFHAKILNGQDTRPFHSSKQPGVVNAKKNGIEIIDVIQKIRDFDQERF